MKESDRPPPQDHPAILAWIDEEVVRLHSSVIHLERAVSAASDDLAEAEIIKRHVVRTPDRFSPAERENAVNKAQARAEIKHGIEVSLRESRDRLHFCESLAAGLWAAAQADEGAADAARFDSKASSTAVADRDGARSERDAARSERDSVQAERDAVLAERDAAIAERDAALAERDAAIAERDGAQTFLTVALAAASERELAATQAAHATAEAVRDALSAATAAAQAEAEAAAATLAAALAERDAALAAAVAERDAAVAAIRDSESAEAERSTQASVEIEHAAAAEREALAAAQLERDAAIAEVNVARSERDSAHAERDTARLERDTAHAERNTAQSERDAAALALEEAQEVRPDTVEIQIIREAASTLPLYKAVEVERLRIARDLHDGPSQLLADLALKAEILERVAVKRPADLQAELDEFKSLVRNAMADMRRFMFDLRPDSLDDLGLVATVRRYANEYHDRTGVTCRFNLHGEERRLPADHEEALFRIIQEALTNVQHHADAKTADVSLIMQASKVVARIRDDGVGFDTLAYEMDGAQKLGIVGMKERAAAVGGTVEIKSHTGGGTEVVADFPLTGT